MGAQRTQTIFGGLTSPFFSTGLKRWGAAVGFRDYWGFRMVAFPDGRELTLEHAAHELAADLCLTDRKQAVPLLIAVMFENGAHLRAVRAESAQ